MEELMGDLLLFVEPGIGRELDLERGFEFLDKELVEMFPEPEKPSNTKVVDKLVKVFLRDGSERWMLFHVEVVRLVSRLFNCSVSARGQPNLSFCRQ